jgi:hypothetical protein
MSARVLIKSNETEKIQNVRGLPRVLRIEACISITLSLTTMTEDNVYNALAVPHACITYRNKNWNPC